MPKIAHKRLEKAVTAAMEYSGDRPSAKTTIPRNERPAFLKSFEPGGDRFALYVEAQNHKTPRDRTLFIAYLISHGEWRGPMVQAFGKAWDLSPSHVATLHQKASKLVALSLGDKDVLRTNMIAWLEKLADVATENGNVRDAVSAIRTIGDFAGIVKHQHEITGADGGPIQMLAAVKQMTDAELEAEIAKSHAARLKRLADEEGRQLTPAEQAIVESALLPPVNAVVEEAVYDEVLDETGKPAGG